MAYRVARSVTNHFRNQCWNIVKLSLRNKLRWHFDQNSYIFIHENAFKNVACEIADICRVLYACSKIPGVVGYAKDPI